MILEQMDSWFPPSHDWNQNDFGQVDRWLFCILEGESMSLWGFFLIIQWHGILQDDLTWELGALFCSGSR